MNILKNITCSIAVGALLLFGSLHTEAQTASPPKLYNFTNALSGVGGLHTTNTLYQLTNGSTTVTSAPVALFRSRGVGLGFVVSPTNALLTNIVAEYRFSPDGTNWMNEPTVLVRTATAAIAAGKYGFKTNLTEDFIGNNRYVQLWKVHLTNGVNNVGSAFATNNGPTFFAEVFP